MHFGKSTTSYKTTLYLDNNMIGCKLICFFGEVPPRQERTKKKPYAGGDRAGTVCRQTDTEEGPGKLVERTSQSLVCQVVRRKSAESAALCAGQGRQPCPVDVMPCVISYWVLSGAQQAADLQLRCTALPLSRARRSLRDPRKERWSLKLTRHNGRAGKHGTYNPKHNDRSFEIANSEHIDPERVQQNIYWDCYNGIRSALQPKSEESLADTFEEVEKLYYKLHYTNFTERQNERNAKIRHTERNRSTEDLLASKKTCPEESIYQLGTLESHASPKELFQIATEFMDEFHERFGKHVHILDWALHLDEGTPHIHERHVFDCENKYGEIAPQQEKALEALGFELPKPDKPLGRYNNRKITFDAACRTMLFEIAKRHGLELDEVPEYGGRAYLGKQDYILKKQNERIAEQKKELQEQSIQYVGLLEDCRNQRDEYAELFNQAIRQSEEISKNNEKIRSQENELEELFSQWVDVNDLFNDAVNGSYDQAVLAVSDVGLNKALQETVNEIDQHLEWLMEPERIADFRTRKYAEEQILCLRKNIIGAIKSLLSRGTQFFYIPEVKKAAMEQIKENTRPSVLQKLHRRQEEINQREQTCTKPKKRSHGMEL